MESQPNYRQSVPKLEVIKKVNDQILEQNQNNFCDWEITKIYLFVGEQ